MSAFTSVRPRSMGAAPAKAAKSSFRPDVQGLRAFAVVAVILAHITGWPSGGFVGVDVFFVISGFLITGLLLREHEKTGRISFSGFYKKRVKRILPASLLVLVVTAATALLLLPKSRGTSTLIDAVWSLFFAGNWRFASSGTDYFNEGIAPSPLQHFWSLAVEEQFYFVWPWLMLGIFWLAARVGRQGGGRVAVGVAMLAISAASFGWAMWETTNNPTVAYFSTLSRAWELGLGALIAVAAPLLVRIPGGVRMVLAWAGLLGLLVSVLVITPESAFPAPWAILPVLATALIICAGTGGEAGNLWPLTNPVSRYVGDISYSLYLWHWPVAILLVAVVESGSLMFYGVALALTLALSIGSYHFVEDPIRHAGGPKATRHIGASTSQRNYAGVAALALLTVTVAGLAVNVNSARTYDSADLYLPSVAAGDETATPCVGAAALDPDSECDRTAITGILKPSIDGMAEDTGNAFACWSGADPKEDMRSCSYGKGEGDKLKAAIVGDSHAASLIPALSADTSAWTLDTYVGNGCRWRAMPNTDSNCGTAMQQIQDRLLEGEPYDLVITSASRSTSRSDFDQAVDQFVEAWTPVLARGTKVVVVADVPAVDPSAIECLTRVGFDPLAADCSTSSEFAFASPDALVAAAGELPEVSVVDINDLICFDDRCPAFVANTIVYRDSAGHLTATYSESLSPYLVERIRGVMPTS